MAGLFSLAKSAGTRKKQLKNRTKFAKYTLSAGLGCSLIYLLLNQTSLQNSQLSVQNFQQKTPEDSINSVHSRSKRDAGNDTVVCDKRCEFDNQFNTAYGCEQNGTNTVNCLIKQNKCRANILNDYCGATARAAGYNVSEWDSCTAMVDTGIFWCDSTEFPEDSFTIEQRRNGWIVVHFMGLLYMFLALAIVCDEYFVPSLEMISEKLDLSDDVAGATFMAAGGSAPELFTSLIGVFIADSNVGIGTIVGSAVFNILFVIGACAFVVGFVTDEATGKPTVLSLTWFPLTRDCIFYIIALSVLIFNFSGDEISGWESISMICVYVSYVSFMMFNSKIEAKLMKKSKVEEKSDDKVENGENAKSESAEKPEHGILESGNGKFHHTNGRKTTAAGRKTIVGLQDIMTANSMVGENGARRSIVAEYAHQRFSTLHKITSNQAIDEDESKMSRVSSARSGDSEDELLDGSPWVVECPSMENGYFGVFMSVLIMPLIICMKYTIPDTRFRSIRGCCGGNIFIASFFLSIMWISIFSWFMVWMATRIGETYNIDAAMMGLTFLAAGTSVPDLITSVIVAKDGHGDMAVSSSIGSNIFDVTIGLPLPWLLWSTFNGWQAKGVDSSGMVCNIGLLLLMLIVLVMTILSTNWKMNHILGFAMIALYGVFVWISLMLEYGTLSCPF
jgi:K+-dependent Na+/Ca+ exchanger-like protein